MMHTEWDRDVVTNTLALYGVKRRSTAYLITRALVRLALIAAIVFIPHALAYAIVPCATEDSTNCVWDSRVQGNGQGASFIDINGTAYYL